MSTKERKKNMGSVTQYTLYDSDCHNVTPDQFVSVLRDYVYMNYVADSKVMASFWN